MNWQELEKAVDEATEALLEESPQMRDMPSGILNYRVGFRDGAKWQASRAAPGDVVALLKECRDFLIYERTGDEVHELIGRIDAALEGK